MRSLKVLALAALAFGVSTSAFADAAADRSAAIHVCRAEVAARAHVDAAQVRLSNVRAHGRTIRVDLDLWRDGQLTNVRCDARVGAEPAIVALNPELADTQAQASAQ